MNTPDPVGAVAAPAAPTDERREAVRGLELAFSEVLSEFRKVYIQAAASVSPGMLPATYKVLSLIQQCQSITVSGLADRLTADKGQVSRSVSELEDLGLVQRTADPADGRIKVITVTPEAVERLARAREPYEGLLGEALGDWPLESVYRLTDLLKALAEGTAPRA
ncbi:MarR family winged helix-turn-helix transcriptional regulator [Protaetiibacter larvae]|uniref:Winged helix-turn-helix transcriptional regulator n=1 Tax=Protaetiibacter larvae TaxID=2592654 RepID=A0A5C1Y4W6_9MICO|nr:MarR family winged helix-turn-helix transcriptional regulator [Protaetiibacter larvae]QEO08934.1 winged helix-turn-helix transcriptional regulator [Protaetiibacter larvae]